MTSITSDFKQKLGRFIFNIPVYFWTVETSSFQQRHSLQAHVSLQLAKDVKPLELVQKLDDDLLCSMSLNYLTKVNITSLDQVNNKTWCPAQVTSMTFSSSNL